MSSLLLHPGLLLIAGGLLLGALRGHARVAAILLLPVAALWLVWAAPDAAAGPALRFLDYSLSPLAPDSLSRLFATIFAIMAFGGGLFAPRKFPLPDGALAGRRAADGRNCRACGSHRFRRVCAH